MSDPVLLITGSLGSGKTTVLGEITDILTEIRVPHAIVDQDALSQFFPRPAGDPFGSDMMFENLSAIWPNFHAAGADRLVLAGILQKRDTLERYRSVLGVPGITVCRLTASVETMQARLAVREPGRALDWHLNRSVELDAILEQAAVGDFSVRNDGRPIGEVAEEVLQKAGWPHRAVRS